MPPIKDPNAALAHIHIIGPAALHRRLGIYAASSRRTRTQISIDALEAFLDAKEAEQRAARAQARVDAKAAKITAPASR